jgi:hypothetical protein
MTARRCAERKAAIAALADYFLDASRSICRPASAAFAGSRAESLRCQVEAHAERLAIVAGLAGQGRGTLADIEAILADLQELGVFADKRLLRNVYVLYASRDARRAA